MVTESGAPPHRPSPCRDAGSADGSLGLSLFLWMQGPICWISLSLQGHGAPVMPLGIC